MEKIGTSLPENYQEVFSWRVTEKPSRVLALNIFGALLFFLFGLIFSALAVNLGKLPLHFAIDLAAIGVLFIAIPLTIILHELAHGIAMRMFGAKPQYGIKWKQLMFYATSPEYLWRRNNYLVIALAPFVLLSILVVLGMWLLQGTVWVALLGICGTINASGAVGDMWITTIVLRYAAPALIMDEQDGIRVFLPKP